MFGPSTVSLLQTTVAEALWVSCRLRFTSDVSDVTARAFVNEVDYSAETFTFCLLRACREIL